MKVGDQVLLTLNNKFDVGYATVIDIEHDRCTIEIPYLVVVMALKTELTEVEAEVDQILSNDVEVIKEDE